MRSLPEPDLFMQTNGVILNKIELVGKDVKM